MTPGSCAPVAGAQVHAPVRVRLRHTSAVNTVVGDLRVVAAGRSRAAGSGSAGAGDGGGATGSDTGAAAAVSAGAGWGCGADPAGAGGGACDDAAGGTAPVDGSGGALVDGAVVDAVRSRDRFELSTYHPATSNKNSTAS